MNPHLTWLELSGNKIGDAGAISLSNALRANSHLQHLNLAANNVKDQGANALSNALRVNTSLHYFDLASNKFGNNGAIAFAAALRQNSTLKTIILSHNFALKRKGLEHILHALLTNSSIEHLGLSLSDVNQKARTLVCELLRTKSRLRHLEFTDRDLSEHDECANLFRSLQANSSLEVLNLSSSIHFRPSMRPKFTAFDELRSNTSLRELGLSSCSITGTHLDSLCEMLRVNSVLKQLDMSTNLCLDLASLKTLCLALTCNRSIQELILKGNAIDDEGMVFVCDMLQKNTTMLQIDLSENKIGNRGAALMGGALRFNSHLQMLNLCENMIEGAGARSMIGAMCGNNTTLQRVDLTDIKKIYAADLRALQKMRDVHAKHLTLFCGRDSSPDADLEFFFAFPFDRFDSDDSFDDDDDDDY